MPPLFELYVFIEQQKQPKLLAEIDVTETGRRRSIDRDGGGGGGGT